MFTDFPGYSRNYQVKITDMLPLKFDENTPNTNILIEFEFDKQFKGI